PAALDCTVREPAMALDKFARAGRQPRIIEALIVEMPIHAVEPRRDPAAAGFQETDADLRMLLAHPAPDHRQAGQHHLHRVRHDVPGTAAFEAVYAHRRHAAAASFM